MRNKLQALTYMMAPVLLTLAPQVARPADPPSAQPAVPEAEKAERVNVENIKQKYWARGDESELGVVQNRLYSKERRFELGVIGSILTTDPFLSVSSFGGSLGYHFTEYISFHAMGWKTFVKPSAAYEAFQTNIQTAGGIPAEPDTNYQRSFYGGEVRASLLYGKLSVVGKAIIYYDFRVLGGLGIMNTETGKNLTPYLGIGQQVFLSKTLSLLIDYRLMRYSDTLLTKSNPANVREGITRTNWTNAITLGFSFFFGPGK